MPRRGFEFLIHLVQHSIPDVGLEDGEQQEDRQVVQHTLRQILDLLRFDLSKPIVPMERFRQGLRSDLLTPVPF